ncbi:hypothetical protein GOP47_0021769 [Adiantum capillus-veneris]|uniref:Inositol polyphosphate-related phosphatase domain-containing protein n=1 Tax=Adiantum capillus-veneris TaxID=13818 RepID=A0A9D4U8Z2_ADICA|nr:hypothetical protein GOP47_0021769 [Adiantum capillus-veneris]
MLPPCHRKTSQPKSIWETTKRWIQMRSQVKDAQIPPSQDAKLAGNEGYEGIHNVDTQQLRLFVGTWNVAGKVPTDKWVIQEWLGSQEAADIYVMGFQEIVPLNAGNVLGDEDKGVSARKWDEFIMKALNESSSCSSAYLYSCSSTDTELADTRRTSSTTAPSSPSSFNGSWFQTHYEEDIGNMAEASVSSRRAGDIYTPSQDIDGYGRQYSYAEESYGRRHSSAEESYGLSWNTNMPSDLTTNSFLSSNTLSSISTPEFVKIASKQMVGLFVSVWIRQRLSRHVKAVDFSAVGCGIMGRLGNKGSISVSLSLHETNFCFICSHLKPGDRPQDIARRNSDVGNILRRTRFHRFKRLAALNLPKTILGHDRIIWFGDLNYRVSLPFKDIKSLVTKRDWGSLLKNDQLKSEQGRGGVLEGWSEGPIYFPPTYKFVPDSDAYVLMQHQQSQKPAHKRAPAWCDRILWYGKGLKQLYYTNNTALRHSDHRPVSAMFIAEVDVMLKMPLLSHDNLLNKIIRKSPYNAVGDQSAQNIVSSPYSKMLAYNC